MDDSQRETIKMLFENGHGYTTISKMLGINPSTVKSFIRRQRLNRNSTERLIKHCENCGKELFQIAKRKPKRFCCDKCRNLWWNSHLDQVNRKAYYSLRCRNCGKEFQAYGDKYRKFCCLECFKQYRIKTAKHPIVHRIRSKETHKEVKPKFIKSWKQIPGQNLSQEWLEMLDNLDHEMYKNDYRQNRMRDPYFDTMLIRHHLEPGEKHMNDPWNRVYNENDCVETILFPETETKTEIENPKVVRVRRFIKEECTEDEKKFINLHFGKQMKLTEISQIESARKGKVVTAATLSYIKKKILYKIAKLFEVECE